ARIRELDGIGSEVEQDLMQTAPIGTNGERSVEFRPGKAQASLRDLGLDARLDRGQRVRDEDVLEVERNLSGVDLRKIQYLIDQTQEVALVVLDAGDVTALHFSEGPLGLEREEIGVAPDSR